MPEMHFTIEWPNGKRERCYSPSYIIEDYFVAGQAYAVPEFLARAGAALEGASERVRQRYGFACSSALDQLRELLESSAELTPEQRSREVTIVEFEKRFPARYFAASIALSCFSRSLPADLSRAASSAGSAPSRYSVMISTTRRHGRSSGGRVTAPSLRRRPGDGRAPAGPSPARGAGARAGCPH